MIDREHWIQYNPELEERVSGFYEDPETETMGCLIWIILGMPGLKEVEK